MCDDKNDVFSQLLNYPNQGESVERFGMLSFDSEHGNGIRAVGLRDEVPSIQSYKVPKTHLLPTTMVSGRRCRKLSIGGKTEITPIGTVLNIH